jgi:hypothetical protein
LRKLPFVAAIVAFLLVALGLLAALQHPVLALFALVPLIAGIGILRKRIWSAYGFFHSGVRDSKRRNGGHALIGDRVLTRVFPRVQPARGDIVVFRYPSHRRETFVKRVIGLPGDPLPACGITSKLVPAGKYFVLGDNRENSLDSRYWGFIDNSDIIGKPILVYDSSAPAARWRRLLKLI